MEGASKHAIHITLKGRHNVTYSGTLFLSHHNWTHQPGITDNGNSTMSDYDQTGASYYVIAVVLVYGMSIVMLIASHIKSRHDKIVEDKQIDKYLQDFQIVRERHDRDTYRSLKKSIMKKINWEKGKKETFTTLQNTILPLLAVGIPRRQSVVSRESRNSSRSPSIELSAPPYNPASGRTRKKGIVNHATYEFETVATINEIEDEMIDTVDSRSDLDSICTESTEKKTVRFSVSNSESDEDNMTEFSGAVGVEAHTLRQQIEDQMLTDSGDEEEPSAQPETLEVVIDHDDCGYDDEMDSSISHSVSSGNGNDTNGATVVRDLEPYPFQSETRPSRERNNSLSIRKSPGEWETFPQSPRPNHRLACELSGKGRNELAGEVVWYDLNASPDSGCATPTKDYLIPAGRYHSLTPSPTPSPGHSPKLLDRTRSFLHPVPSPTNSGRTSPRQSGISLGTIITRTLTNSGYPTAAPTPKYPPSPKWMYTPRKSRSRSPSPRPPTSGGRTPSPQPPPSPNIEQLLQITCV